VINEDKLDVMLLLLAVQEVVAQSVDDGPTISVSNTLLVVDDNGAVVVISADQRWFWLNLLLTWLGR
jgi:hypothetical protein